MPTRLEPGRADGRTTDHSNEIHHLRRQAAYAGELRREAYETSAALLEAHDAGLISLDDWSPRRLVINCLQRGSFESLLDNGLDSRASQPAVDPEWLQNVGVESTAISEPPTLAYGSCGCGLIDCPATTRLQP